MELKQGALGGGLAMSVAQIQAITGATAVSFSPTSGSTVTVPASDRTISLISLEPAAELDALTVKLPADAVSRLGQRIFVRSSRQISNVTFQSDGGTVDNWLVMLSAGDCVDFTKVKAATWSRGVS